jgi:HSP20 family protein
MLVRYDPFRAFDRPFPRSFDRSFDRAADRRSFMPMDAVRHEHHVELRFDLPGIAPDAIDVEVERNVLTVRAERSWSLPEGAEMLTQERPQGSVTRRVTLGESLDTEHLEATYDAGVLVLTIPVIEQAKARKVEVQVGAPEALEVEAGSQN